MKDKRGLGLTLSSRHPRTGPLGHLVRLAALTLAVTAVAILAPPASPSRSQGLPPDPIVDITDTGFQPATVTIQPGQGIHWTNRASGPHSVTNSTGLFDSGSLAPGAGYSMALAIPGDHAYHSSSNPAFSGSVRVARSGLSGPPGTWRTITSRICPIPRLTLQTSACTPSWGLRPRALFLLWASHRRRPSTRPTPHSRLPGWGS